MAEDEDLDEEEIDEDDDEEGAPPPSGGGKKKLFIIVGVVLLLLVGGVAGAYFTGLLDPVMEMVSGTGGEEDGEGEDGDGTQEREISDDAVFYDLPEILVNLSSTGRKSTFIKIRMSLELGSSSDVAQVEKMMPRILDNFQVYLRELRIDDLKGSAGMFRLRQELLSRVTAAAAPADINDLLFKEMLVQ